VQQFTNLKDLFADSVIFPEKTHTATILLAVIHKKLLYILCKNCAVQSEAVDIDDYGGDRYAATDKRGLTGSVTEVTL